MEKKSKIAYLILGIGMGIILSSTIYSFFPKVRLVELNEAEIIEKAKELGMVTLTESLNREHDYNDLEMNKTEINDIDEEVLENEINDIDEEALEEEANDTTSEEKKTIVKQENTVKPKEAIVQAVNDDIDETTEEEFSEDIDDEEYISIYVAEGDSSYMISRKLFNAGLIDDYQGFIDYIKDNNAETILLYGKYNIRKSSTYEEILKLLITKRK